MKEIVVYKGTDSDEWETPHELFKRLHDEFQFTVDAAASKQNAKLPRYWTTRDDGLAQDWSGERVWVNPPYSRPGPWLYKAAQTRREGAHVVMLVPASVGSRVWWQWVWPHVAEIRILYGRLKFLCNGTAAYPARFESAVLIYRPVPTLQRKVIPWNWQS